MTSARVAASAMMLALVLAGILRAEIAFFAAAVPVGLYLALGLFLGPPRLSLSAERSVSSRFLPAHGHLEITVRVTCTGSRIDFLKLEDRYPPEARVVDGSAEWKGTLERGEVAVLRYVLEMQRGCFSFSDIVAEAESPFSSLKSSASIPCPASVAVYPLASPASAIPFRARAARPFSGESRTRRTGAGTDFSGTREYTPGDPLRHLNWRAEALWGRPVVNVFEEERAIDIGIILDCRSEAYGGQEGFEHSAAAALSMAEQLLDQGHRVAFLNYGSLLSWTPPGSGRDHRSRIRMAAARAELGAHAAFDCFENLPVRLFPPRSLVLLVSPLGREDVAPLRSLKALGYEVAVLRPRETAVPETSIDPIRGLARRILDLESDVLLSRLLRAGITILDWNTSTPLASLRAHGSICP